MQDMLLGRHVAEASRQACQAPWNMAQEERNPPPPALVFVVT